MARYHGRAGKLYMAADGTGNAVNITPLTKWSVSFTRDKVEVTALTDANKQYVQGLADVSGSFSGFYDDVETAKIFTAAASSNGSKLYLYPSNDAMTKYFYGPAWIDVSDFTVDVGGAVSISGTFSANGAWGTPV